MYTRLTFLLALACLMATLSTAEAKEPRSAATPYVGEWSNGRGETLIITAKTLKFAGNNPVAYRDITRATDGKTFQLEVTTPGKLNYLSRFMTLTLVGKEEMKSSGADVFNGEITSQQSWFRDK